MYFLTRVSFFFVFIESLTQTKNTNSSASVISLLMITVACISGIFIWTMYAYRNPHSASGQILIRVKVIKLFIVCNIHQVTQDLFFLMFAVSTKSMEWVEKRRSSLHSGYHTYVIPIIIEIYGKVALSDMRILIFLFMY